MHQQDPNDEKLIKLFKQLPTIEDKRSVDEVYRNIKKAIPNKRKNRVFVPVLSGIAALILFILIVPNFLQQADKISYNQDQGSPESGSPNMELRMHSGKDDVKIAQEESTNDKAAVDSEISGGENREMGMAAEFVDDSELTAVYRHDLLDHQVATFGILTEEKYVVPVSVLVPQNPDNGWVDRYRYAAKILDQENYSTVKMTPLIESVKVDEGKGIASVNIEHDFAYFNIFGNELTEAIKHTFRDQSFEEVNFVNNDGGPAELGNYGVIQPLTEKELKQPLNRVHYLYNVDDKTYIVPDSTESGDSFKTAISKMKDSPNDFYQSAIPTGVTPEVKGENEKIVTVGFDHDLTLKDAERQKFSYMIEAILLSAKEFGYTKVKFENIKEPTHWKEHHFDDPIDVPIRPNNLMNR